MSGHALVVGGTGMLRGVCLRLAASELDVSVVARRAPDFDGVHHVRADWRDASALRAAVEAAVAARGPIDPAVCWIHSNGPDAPAAVIAAIGNEAAPPRYFQIYGSGADATGAVKARWRRELPAAKSIRYREIVLGSIAGRWLTDDEISAGVIEAVESDVSSFRVGDAP